MQSTDEIVAEWLETFSPVESMRDNPEALAKEMATITAVLSRDQATVSQIEAAFQHIKQSSHSRAWPTAAMVFDALKHIKRSKVSEPLSGGVSGDRFKLSGSERSTLEGDLIPSARRWLRMYPGLRNHAKATLQYWGEPLTDDMGKHYE